MSGASPILTKSFVAGTGGVDARSLAKLSADGEVVMADDADEAIIGVASELDVAAGKMADIHMAGVCDVLVGTGDATRGTLATATAAGAATDATPGTEALTYAVGFFLASGVAGDIVPLLLAPQAIAVDAGA